MSNPAADAIYLLLVDDHAMFRDGLTRVIEKEPDLKLVGQSGSSSEALDLLKTSGATMVLLDIDLGGERGSDFIGTARRAGFQGQILVVTAGVSDAEAIQLIHSGAAGILHKSHSAAELCATIRQVARGEVYLEQNYLAPLFRSVDRAPKQGRPRLTDRDKMILRFIFQGLTNREIGARLEITEGAVKASLRQLCEKLGVRTRAQLVKVALEQYRDQL